MRNDDELQLNRDQEGRGITVGFNFRMLPSKMLHHKLTLRINDRTHSHVAARVKIRALDSPMHPCLPTDTGTETQYRMSFKENTDEVYEPCPTTRNFQSLHRTVAHEQTAS